MRKWKIGMYLCQMHKYYFLLFSIVLLFSCGEEEDSTPPVAENPAKLKVAPNFVKAGGEAEFLFQLGKKADNISIYSGAKELGKSEGTNSIRWKAPANEGGYQNLKFKVLFEDGTQKEFSHKILVTAPKKITELSVTVNKRYKHDALCYTQGLEFHQGKLYESGGQYNESNIRIWDYRNGKIVKEEKKTNDIFSEGLTIMNDKIYQLTWQNGFIEVLNLDFERLSTSPISSTNGQGWGICNDGEKLYLSDGTATITVLDTNLNALRKFQVVSDQGIVNAINELEYHDGYIYANVYQAREIIKINPNSGFVEAFIDLSSLYDDLSPEQTMDVDVLNGVAYNPETSSFFVTGKYFPYLWDVTFTE